MREGWRLFSLHFTGSAQIAIGRYRLYEYRGIIGCKMAAEGLADLLKPLRALDTPDPALNGAIAGSFPLFGGYMRAGFPNWATKYFIDALLLQHRHDG